MKFSSTSTVYSQELLISSNMFKRIDLVFIPNTFGISKMISKMMMMTYLNAYSSNSNVH